MRRFLSYIIGIFFILQLTVNAGEYNKAGTAVAQFLKIESGARPSAMGGAYSAIANDAYSLFWNVAGLAEAKSIQGNFTYTNWIADLTHNYAAVVIPIEGAGNIGISVITLNTGEIEQTTIKQPHGTGIMVDASDIAIGISYARFMTDYVSIGITGKYIQQNLWEVSAKTVAFDVGFLLHTGYKGIRLGLTLSNFGPEMQLAGRNLIRGFDNWDESVSNPNVPVSYETASWPLPTSYRVSASIDLLGAQSSLFNLDEKNKLVFVADALHPNDNPEHYSFGMEYSFNDWIFLRSGYKLQTDERGLAFGGGLRLPLGENFLFLDYAFADFGKLESVQQYSISFSF